MSRIASRSLTNHQLVLLYCHVIGRYYLLPGCRRLFIDAHIGSEVSLPAEFSLPHVEPLNFLELSGPQRKEKSSHPPCPKGNRVQSYMQTT